ncbi:TIGR03899 family protein [Thalassotalea sp. PLHSN55]|uniref:TIGR03899 family protein n=1 Tax=Thalassotalea sp. PLHSN55 TaxID=3435888 RepID=UPI003F86B52B
MSSSDDNKNDIVVSNNEHTVVVESQAAEDKTAATSKGSSNASSQMQLLGLAKQFSLDGQFLPPEKQIPIEDRARKRDRLNHLRHQQNLERIIQKAVGLSSDSQVPDRTDQDWFDRFLSLAESISNKTMQDLWARILAKEIASPGSFSLKALKTFRELSIQDAKLLAKVAKFTVRDKARKNLRILSGSYQTPNLFNFFSKSRQHKINLNQYGLSYSDLLNLDDNHLLFIQEAESSVLAKGEVLTFSYNGLALSLSAKKADSVLCFYKFTPVGVELMNLIGDKADEDFYQSLKRELSTHFNCES